MLIIFVFLNTHWVETTIKGIKCIKQDVLATCDSNPTQTGLSIRRNIYGLIYVKIPNTELVSAGTAWYMSSNYAIIFLPLPPLLIFAFSILACSSVKYSPSDIKTSIHSFTHSFVHSRKFSKTTHTRLQNLQVERIKKSLWRTNLKGKWRGWSLSHKGRIILPLVSDSKLERSYRETENIGSWTCVSNFIITGWRACLWMGQHRGKESRDEEKNLLMTSFELLNLGHQKSDAFWDFSLIWDFIYPPFA